MGILAAQHAICSRFNSEQWPAPLDSKVGVALQTIDLKPLNALRHSPEDGTTGWFIWGGEVMSSAEDFFSPLHVSHLVERVPEIAPYLGLAPGFRVLLAPGHEDVWFDSKLCTLAP